MGLWPGLYPAASPTQSSQVSTTGPEIRGKDSRTIKGGVRWGGLGDKRAGKKTPSCGLVELILTTHKI